MPLCAIILLFFLCSLLLSRVFHSIFAPVHVCTGPHFSVDRNTYCLFCSSRILPSTSSRPHNNGRVHKRCLLSFSRSSSSSSSLSTAATALPSSSITPTRNRSKKPYEQLKPTQKRERRKQMREAMTEVEERIGCPATAVVSSSSTTPSSLLHLSTSDRHRIRSVESISIPCESSIIQLKKQLASTYSTSTSAFSTGAYISDPLALIAAVVPSSSFICIGGDTGGEYTKLGVTYLTSNNTQSFVCLLVYEGNDSWEELNKLKSSTKIKFVGGSASYPHIFAVLQHLIDTHSAYLNGDWAFINSVLGLKSASATQPCPICTVCKNNLLASSTYRSLTSKESLHPTHPPLISIQSNRIVPTPLHLLLGIGNKIIDTGFRRLWGEEAVKSAVETIKTVHTPGCGGRSDWKDLNGPEIRKWIKKTSVTN